MEKKRPVGATIIAVVCILYSLWAVTLGMLGYMRTIGALQKEVKLSLQFYLPIIFILFNIGFLISGMGILALKDWARRLILAMAGLTIPMAFVSSARMAQVMLALIKSGTPPYANINMPQALFPAFTVFFVLVSTLPTTTLCLAILIYFTRTKVKERFN
jgi:hypothetical protein